MASCILYSHISGCNHVSYIHLYQDGTMYPVGILVLISELHTMYPLFHCTRMVPSERKSRNRPGDDGSSSKERKSGAREPKSRNRPGDDGSSREERKSGARDRKSGTREEKASARERKGGTRDGKASAREGKASGAKEGKAGGAAKEGKAGGGAKEGKASPKKISAAERLAKMAVFTPYTQDQVTIVATAKSKYYFSVSL